MDRLNRIKVVLTEKGIQQKQLAEHLGKSTNAVASFCNNKSQPHLKELYRIAEYLDVDICELLVPSKKN